MSFWPDADKSLISRQIHTMLSKKPGNVFIWSGALLFVIILWLSWNSEWEYDEAWSYWGTDGTSFLDILRYSHFKVANNHLFNSLYFHVMQSLHAKNVFFYRIMSFSSLLIYIYYLRRLFGLYKEKYGLPDKASIPGSYTILFLMLPFALYFSIGRGYAFAMAAFTASLYYFNLYLEKRALKALMLFLLSGAISSLAIFSFVFVFLVMGGLLVWIVITNRSLPRMGFPNWKDASWSYVLLLPCLAFVACALLYVFSMGKVVSTDPNIIGNNSLFVNGAGSSLISFMCFQDFLPDKTFKIIKIIFLLSAVPMGILFVLGKKIYRELIILAGVFAAFFICHKLLGSKYPLGRGLSFMCLLIYLHLFVAASRKPHFFYAVHFYVAILIGSIGLGVYAYKTAIKPNSNDVLRYVQNNHGKGLLIDRFNPNIFLENHLYFQEGVKIVRSDNPVEFKNKIVSDTVDFAMATRDSAAIIAVSNGYHEALPLGNGMLLKK